MKFPRFRTFAPLALALALLLCLLPATVSAADSYEASVTVGETITPYATLQEAITAAQAAPGSMVTLLSGVTVDETIVISSGTFTLDLNGQMVSDTLDHTGLPVFQVASGANLTVTDRSSAQTGEIGVFGQYVDRDNPAFENAGSLTITGGIITGYPGIQNTGTLYLKGGHVRGADPNGAGGERSGVWSTAGKIYVHAPAVVSNRLEAHNTVVEVTGGTISSMHIENGSLQMTGGEIYTMVSHCTFYAINSTIDISNSSISGVIAMSLHDSTVSLTDTSVTGGFIFSEGCIGIDGGSLTVQDCTFTRRDTSHNVFTLSNGATVTVYNATFTNGIKVSGSTLNAILAKNYIYFDKDGNVVVPGSTDTATADTETYTVARRVAATVTTTGGVTTEYPVLEWAVAAAEASASSVLKLQMDQSQTATLPITTGGFTMDLNGFALSTGGVVISPDASLTLTDSGNTQGSLQSGSSAITNAGSLWLRDVRVTSTGSTITSSGEVTLCGNVDLSSQEGAQLVLENGAPLYLDSLADTDAYTVQLLDASGAFTTGAFGYRPDGGSVDTATAAQFTSTQDPYYVVQVNGAGDLEVAPATVQIIPEVVWADGSDADGLRPDSVTITVTCDGATAASQAIHSGKYTFTLPKYDGTTALTYSLSAPDVAGYEKTLEGSRITYTRMTQYTGTVQWDDGNDQDGIRPDSVELDILDKSGAVAATVTAYAKDGWTYTVDVAKYYSDTLNTCTTALSAPLSGYTDAGGVLTHTPETLSLTVKLVWEDGGNADRLRPETVSIPWTADGSRQTALTATGANTWTVTAEVPRYRDGGQAIVYALSTVSVKDYTATVSGDLATGFTVTLSHTPLTNGSAQTGDSTAIALYLALAVLSLGGVAVLTARKRRF